VPTHHLRPIRHLTRLRRRSAGSAFVASPVLNTSPTLTSNALISSRFQLPLGVGRPLLTHSGHDPLTLRSGRAEDRRVHRNPQIPLIRVARLGPRRRDRGRGDLLRESRPHRQARVCDELHRSENLVGDIPTLRRRACKHGNFADSPLPRSVVPERIRPPPKLDARLRSHDGEVPAGRSPRAGGRGVSLRLRRAEPDDEHGPDGGVLRARRCPLASLCLGCLDGVRLSDRPRLLHTV
jgi:hypothetical protein